MTTRRRIVRRPTAARSQPRYTWRMWEGGSSTLDAAAAPLTFVLNTVGSNPDLKDLGVFGDFTVRRVLGMIWAVSTLATELNAVSRFAWGLLIADRDAVSAAALPAPLSDAADWFGFGEVACSQQGAFTAGVHPMTQVAVESRAMRRVNENNQDIILRMEAATGNAADITVVTLGRLLVSHGQR